MGDVQIGALHDLEARARRALPRFLFDSVAGGAEDGRTMAANRQAFEAYALVPQGLSNVSKRQGGVTLLGQAFSQPFGIAPMGGVALCAKGGDVAMAASSSVGGVPLILSGAAFTPLEMVAAANPRLWFQVLPPSAPGALAGLLDRVVGAGVQHLVVTIDLAAPGIRDADLRHGFQHPVRINRQLVVQALQRPGWLFRTGLSFATGTPPLPNVAAEDDGRPPDLAGFTLARLSEIRRRWPGHLVVKGILHPQTARQCLDAGADALIVSNHGGRQLDGSVASLHMLGEIKAVAGGRPVMLDGGVRRGSEIVKAYALGADFVFLGRPFLYALASGGRPLLDLALQLLGREVDRALALCGRTSVLDLDASLLRPSGQVADRPTSSDATARSGR